MSDCGPIYKDSTDFYRL